MNQPYNKVTTVMVKKTISAILENGKVVVSPHCKRRMNERGIYRDELDEELLEGSFVQDRFERNPPPPLRVYILQKEVEARVIRVPIHFETDDSGQLILILRTCFEVD